MFLVEGFDLTNKERIPGSFEVLLVDLLTSLGPKMIKPDCEQMILPN